MASASAKLQVNTQDTSKPAAAEPASPKATVQVPQPVTPEPSPSKKRPELRPQTKTPKHTDKVKDKEASPAKPLRENATPNKATQTRAKGWDKKTPGRPDLRKDDKGRDDNRRDDRNDNRRDDRNDRIERRRDDRRPNQHNNSNNWERQKKDQRNGYNSDDRSLLSDKPLAPVHPLQCSWMFWLSLPQGVTQSNDRKNRWESNLKELGSNFSSVEHFWGYVHHMEAPSRLEYNSSYYLFKSGIKPMWEHEDNIGGGKWLVQLKGPDHVDEVWQNVMLAIVGEAFDAAGDAITGAVVNRRRPGTGSKGSRVAVWLRKTSEEVIAELGDKIKAVATDGLEIDVTCSFSVHNTEPPTPLGGE